MRVVRTSRGGDALLRRLERLLVGMTIEAGREAPCDTLGRWHAEARERGGVHGTAVLSVVGHDNVVVTDPDDVAHVMVRNGMNYGKSPRVRFVAALLGEGLVTIESEAKHAVHRKALNPAFATPVVRDIAASAMLPHFARMVDEVRQQVQAAIAADAASHGATQTASATQPTACMRMDAALDLTTLRIISDSSFRTDQFEGLAKKMRASIRPSALMLLGPAIYNRLPFGPVVQARSLRSYLTTLVRPVIATRRQQQNTTTTDDGRGTSGSGKVLIDYLVESDALEATAVLDHAVTFVFAGHETTSTALNWLLVRLAQHRDVQAALHEELSAAFAVGTTPSADAVAQLPYLRAACLEALRFDPPVMALLRSCRSDDVLPTSGVFVPAGASIMLNIFGAHRNRRVWGADADAFRPERFLEQPELAHHRTAFLPFSVGRRHCIGREFAVQELCIGAALLCRNFEFAWPDGQPEPKRRAGIVVRPEPAVALLVSER